MLTSNKLFKLLIFCIIALVAIQCAQIGTITGGDKDVKPPVVLSTDPEMYALNFNKKKVRINFDEYIQLKDLSQQFNVSPPMKKKPKVWINNRSLIIEYTDTLKDSTTYSLNFGNSIADNNEGNILENYEFVFSTTNYIDSMGVQGIITDAFTSKADKESFLVALYSNLSDTAPLTQVPMFTGRTLKNGSFAINNVKNGTYRLFAFKDKNSNFKYDPLSEAFAFADTLIVLKPEFIKSLISLEKLEAKMANKNDTTKAQSDTLPVQTLDFKNKMLLELSSFTEKDKKQYVKDFSWKERKKINLLFNNKLAKDSFSIQPIYYNVKDWYKAEMGPNGDSLLIWITDTSLLKTDSLRSIVSYWGTSPKLDSIWKSDTLNIRFSESDDNVRRKKKANDTLPETAKLMLSNTSQLDLDATVSIESEFPITKVNPSFISLIQKVDSIEFPRKFKVEHDSIFPRRFNIIYKWEAQEQYKLIIYPGSFENIYGMPYDTINATVSTQKEEFYGKYTFNISGVGAKHLILQLLTNDKVMYEKYLNGDGAALFNYLKPGKYILKVIIDDNNDRIFTTGDFSKKRQAERVFIFKDEISVRSNWETAIDWQLEF